MSDILIKNMKMPKDCLHCGFSHMASDCLKIWIICKIKDISVTDGDAVKDGRPDWCPIIELPKHGRLIDADAFVKEKQEWYCKQNCERRKGIKNGKKCFIYKIGEAPCRACEIDDLISAVDDAPTIIETEGEE